MKMSDVHGCGVLLLDSDSRVGKFRTPDSDSDSGTKMFRPTWWWLERNFL